MSSNQCTLGQSVSVSGASLHTGSEVVLTLHPAPPGHGRKFKRADLQDEPVIDARIDHVKTVERALELGGKLLLTADHGNCELMRNPDGSPNTAHTTNLVQFIYVAADAGGVKLDSGILADVAPTLLDMLGVPKPAEMTGRSLIRKK